MPLPLPFVIVDDAQVQANFDEIAKQFPVKRTHTKGFMLHGADAAATRPFGYVSVEWVGTVSPANGVTGDTWIHSGTGVVVVL